MEALWKELEKLGAYPVWIFTDRYSLGYHVFINMDFPETIEGDDIEHSSALEVLRSDNWSAAPKRGWALDHDLKVALQKAINMSKEK